jgi:L-erythrulose 1-phosphate isomerase
MKFHFGTNWKMSKTNTQARQFVTELLPLLRGQDLSRHYLFVIPSFTAVPLVRDAVRETGLPLHVGAQNVHWEDGVEATGEISARILADIPVDLVEIGHSERRQKFGETDADINLKVRAAIARKLPVLLCLGESRSDKQRGIGLQILERQVRIGLEGISHDKLPRVKLAYEPVWAIGAAGEPADPSYVREQHLGIRQVLAEIYSPETAAGVPLLYGGSVNVDNFRSYAQLKDVDGLFVGRAAWEPKAFLQLMEMSREFSDRTTPS